MRASLPDAGVPLIQIGTGTGTRTGTGGAEDSPLQVTGSPARFISA